MEGSVIKIQFEDMATRVNSVQKNVREERQDYNGCCFEGRGDEQTVKRAWTFEVRKN